MKLFISLCLLVLTHALYAVQFQVKGIVLDNEGKTVPGEYHFHLTVTDKEGNQTAVESDVSIQELMD